MRKRPDRRETRRRREAAWLVHAMLRLGAAVALVLRPFGVDRTRFLALLEVRLLEDIGRGRAAAEEKRPGIFPGGMVMTLVMHLLIGILLAVVVYGIQEPMTGLTFALAVVMVFVTTTLMSEHASTLFETTDLHVLGPLPVDGRTVLASRVAHTLLYILLLVVSIGLPPLAAGILRFGWPFAPAFVLALALGTTTCYGLALTLLVLALRFVPAARVRSFLLTLQIGTSLLAFVSFQLPSLMEHVPDDWHGPDSWWPWLLPPAHGAALVVRAIGSPGAPPVGVAVLAFVLPFCLLAAIALAARSFHGRLQAMASSDRSAMRPPRRAWLRDLILHRPESLAGYDFLAALTWRERQFRMRAWPVIAMAWFAAGWIVYRSAFRGDRVEPALACLALYMLGVVTPQILMMTRFSDDWQARWLFSVAPLQLPARFVHGAMLALALRFVLPVTLLTLAVVLALGGRAIVLDAAYAVTVVMVLTLLTLLTGERRMPFTRKFNAREFSGNVGRSFAFMLLAGLLAVLHTLARGNTAVFLALLGTGVVVVALLVRAYALSLHRPDRVRLDFGDERAVRASAP